MQALRAFLNREHSLLNSLKEIADPQGRFADKTQEDDTAESGWIRSWDDSPEGVRWHSNLQADLLACVHWNAVGAIRPILLQAIMPISQIP